LQKGIFNGPKPKSSPDEVFGTHNDLKSTKAGLLLYIRTSKTDQERLGQIVAIAPGKIVCPFKSLRAWMAAAKITSGPIFRPIFNGGHVSTNRLSDRAVAEIVKTYVKRIGLDPTSFSAHSLRAGFLTSAAQSGASVFKMMDVSRHKRMDTVRGYIRDTELFHNHAGNGLL
jgi:site-specific recombinase XerD